MLVGEGVTGVAVGGIVVFVAVGRIGVFEGLTVGVTGVTVGGMDVAAIAGSITVQPLFSVTVNPKVMVDTGIGLPLKENVNTIGTLAPEFKL